MTHQKNFGNFPARVLLAALLAALLAIPLSLALVGCGGEPFREPERVRERVDSGERSSSVKGVAVKPVQDEPAARACHLLVNDERARRGMRTLSRRADLDAVAYAHARDLLRMNKLTHISSDGRQLENRLARLDWEWAGENLARNKGYSAPATEAVAGWVASPKHFENMFRPDFTHTGMAALYDPESGFTYFVQVFITPV